MEIDEFVIRLSDAKRHASGWSARCPAHEDRVSSLMVREGRDGGVVVKCHAGCDTGAVLDSLSLSFADLMGVPRHVATYEYRELDGTLRYAVERWSNPKTFRCVPGLPAPAERILYQRAAVEWARANDEVVYVVEGEKDVDRLLAAGKIATTNVTGAGAWLSHYSEALRDCHVCVIADNDEAGRAHARAVVVATRPYAKTLSLVVPRIGKDVSELLDAGYAITWVDPLADEEEVGSYQASSIRPRRVTWLWSQYVPAGKLAIIEGDPGDGKSILTIDLAARWSTGAPMPDGSEGGGPFPVILVSAEDDLDDTIVPRLIAAGARLEGIHLVAHGARPEDPFEFATGLPAIERLAAKTGARMVVFDPVTAFLSEKTDSHNDASVRRALMPLKVLAGRTGLGVLVVRHLNKGGAGTKAIYRGGGSIAFTGAARATFVVAPDPREASGRIFASIKSNLSKRPPSLRYEVEANAEGVPYIVWRGAAEIDAQTILDGPKLDRSSDEEERDSKRRARREEQEFLIDLLSNGPMTWADIKAAGKSEGGFSEVSLRRARADVGLMKVSSEHGNAGTQWALRPGDPGIDASSHSVTDPGSLAHLLSDSESHTRESKQVSKRASGPDSTTDSDRESIIDAAPQACDVCGSIDAQKYYEPWFVVRCEAHNPIDYEARP